MYGGDLSLAEKFLLLALDDEKGRFYATNSVRVGYGLAAAVLVVLALRKKILLNDHREVEVTGSRENDEIYKPNLDLIKQSALKKPVYYWLIRIARNHLKNQQVVLKQLCAKGILAQEDVNVHSCFNIKNYPTKNPHPEQNLRTEILKYVGGKQPLPTSLYFLLVLIDSSGIFEEVFMENHRTMARARLDEIKELDIPIGARDAETLEVLKDIRDSLNKL